ncbi:MAG: hypothetical protein M3300_14300, partial [Actinomycetota bacterium]|nr:hypothetical protein [Actinomycetota bacterium]
VGVVGAGRLGAAIWVPPQGSTGVRGSRHQVVAQPDADAPGTGGIAGGRGRQISGRHSALDTRT